MSSESDSTTVLFAILLVASVCLLFFGAVKCRRRRNHRERFVVDIDSKGDLCTAGSKDPMCGPPNHQDKFETPGTTGFPHCEALKLDPAFPCGTYTRFANCFDQSGKLLPASQCSSTKPNLKCVKECDYTNWVVKVGKCEGNCGEKGMRRVTAECPQGQKCDPAKKPQTGTFPCDTDKCEWSIEEGPCLSASGNQCGTTDGNRTVTVKCNGSADRKNFGKCPASTQPSDQPKTCKLSPCNWNTSQWVQTPDDPDIKCSNINGVCQDPKFCTKGGKLMPGLCGGSNRVCCAPTGQYVV